MMSIKRRLIVSGTAAAVLGGAVSLFLRPLGFGAPRRKLTAAEKQSCTLTVEATEGPYWVSGVPELAGGNLNGANLPGIALEVSGRVLSGGTPAAHAEVEIWHADSTGTYHPNGNGPADGYKPEDIALRGFVKTNAEGRYQFTSIYPGAYTGRVRHFHFKIRVPGKPELTTQLILPAKPGDTLTFDTDDIAEGLPNCQLLTVDESATPAKASFDFRV
jgi:protocatechuate 3,4-dioxygenase beta subunit